MKLILSRGAARQLEEILDYIELRNPQGARNVQRRIQAVLHMLLEYPAAGAKTDEPGTHRIVVNPYPYVVLYQVRADDVIIERIRHTAREAD